MSEQITVTVHAIAEDGLPDMDALVGRVAFIFDGCVVSGWPLFGQFVKWGPDGHAVRYGQDVWEADTDVGHNRPMSGVTHWVEFPMPVQHIEKPHLREQR